MLNRFFRRRRPSQEDVDAALDLCAVTAGLLKDAYVPRQTHDKRVRDLLDGNNRELEKRRQAEQDNLELERQVMRAARKALQNAGVVKALDWLKGAMDSRTHYQRDAFFFAVAAFVAGYTGETYQCHGELQQRAHEAGCLARVNQSRLESAAQSVGLMMGSD